LNRIAATVLAILASSFAIAQSAGTTPVQRQVQGQTVTSRELPAAELTFAKDFRYVGGQVANLYGIAEAEQHLFVKGASSGPVESFYWIQFEHYLPGKPMTYKYEAIRTTGIGGLQFIYDVASFSDYASVGSDDPASDGAAMSRLLKEHNLAFPKKAVRVRMFHLPSPDRRSELMIIYGEDLAHDSKIPATEDGVHLDDAAPAAAKEILAHAKQGLSIRKR
jgi:hypothetical protein